MFAELRAELEPHMFKEERILFPAIRQLEQSSDPPAFPFGTVANPIGMMEHEHDNAGEALASIRTLTSDYRVPEDACNTYRAMLDGLRRSWKSTCTSTSTRRTTSCSRGPLNWKRHECVLSSPWCQGSRPVIRDVET